MRQMRAQLRAKCENAPLRRSVTERAMRSTLTALISQKSYKTQRAAPFHHWDRLTFTYSSIRRVALRARAREAQRRASSDVRAR